MGQIVNPVVHDKHQNTAQPGSKGTLDSAPEGAGRDDHGASSATEPALLKHALKLRAQTACPNAISVSGLNVTLR